MKKSVRILLAVALALLMLCTLVACGETGGQQSGGAENNSVSCTITFDSNGGSAVANMVVDGKSEITIPKTTKEGYSFSGWFVDNDTFNVRFNLAYITANPTLTAITVYAKWTVDEVVEQTYTVAFDSNGGSAVLPITQDYNTLVAKPTDPTKTGYTFEAWYKDSNFATAFNFVTDMLTENTTLFAKWTINKYTVTFNSNGGSAVLPLTQDYNTSVTKPTDPTKTGYTFEAWYKESSLSIIFDFATDKLTKDTTLYANWTINKYTVTFDSNGGSDVASITQDYNTSVTKPIDPTKTENVFGGWYKDSNFATAFNFATDMLTENTTLYAKWTINKYTVTFNSNGGSAVAPITQDYNTSVTKPTDPTKTGYTFEAWYKESSLSIIFDFATDKLTKDTTLYANWTINKYTVTFDSNGGSAVLPLTQDYNTSVTKPTDPIKTGYTFEAWYKDSNFATAFNFATDMLTENTTLFANWTINKYTVTFNSNGGSDVASITQDYNTSVTKPIDPTKTENVFGGWYKYSNFATPFNFATDLLTKDTTLYAKWITVASADLFDFTFTDSTNTAYSIKKKADATLPNEIALPSSYNGKPVIGIGQSAFSGCTGLISITIPNSVTSIGYRAFNGCTGLTSVTIPNSVTSIEGGAFYMCSGLRSITFGSGVTSIVLWAFEGCSGLASLTVDKGNAKYHSAGNCIIETATKTLIGGCKSSVIPTDGRVTSIGDSAFYQFSGLTSITIPSTVTSIGDGAFYQCSGLTSVTIPNSVVSIGYGAFAGTAWLNNQPDGLVYAGKVAYCYKGIMPKNTTITLRDDT
ncbi:MAG: InlB B-repeat-containing protein, partial [Clostridia bacterium]